MLVVWVLLRRRYVRPLGVGEATCHVRAAELHSSEEFRDSCNTGLSFDVSKDMKEGRRVSVFVRQGRQAGRQLTLNKLHPNTTRELRK